jgi:hypothetical protein
MMSFVHMKTFCHYVLVAVICFSLMGSCPVGEAFCLTQHDNAEMSSTSHRVHAHATSENFHVPSVHESHQIDLSEQCCETSSKVPSDCARVFVLPNKTKTFRSPLIAAFSAQIAINCFQLSEKNYISEITNTINPTLASLRTVILLA